ncbi:glutathione transferase [Apiospora arundinis]
MSGLGPYYSQCGWFQHLHPEKYQPAIDRYANEIRRMLAVLEGVLAARPADAQWLVGGKMTFADMAFVPWNFRLSEVLNQSWDQVWEGFPHFRDWHKCMVDLPSWKRSMEIRARLMDEQGLQWNGVLDGRDATVGIHVSEGLLLHILEAERLDLIVEPELFQQEYDLENGIRSNGIRSNGLSKAIQGRYGYQPSKD